MSKDANRALVQDASLLVGMHPDEATDAILDVALAFRKPFAIVPCCVFGQKFPDRRLPDGSPVLSYEDLVQYLKAKHPRIQSEFLPFDGRNLALFMTPEDAAIAATTDDATLQTAQMKEDHHRSPSKQ